MESYPLASLITDRGTGSSSASGSRDEHAPIADAADDGGRDLLLEFTSECELEAGAPEIAVDVSDVDDALMGEFEADYTPLSLHALVVTAPAIPPITVRSRLTTDWQMQAARAAIVVRRRTWTVQRLSRSVVSGFSRTVGFIRTASFSRTAGFSATSALTRTSALSRSRLAVPILPFVYGVIFGGVTVLLATGQLHERPSVSPGRLKASSARPSTTSVAATAPLTSEPALSALLRQRDERPEPRPAPAIRPVRLERGTSGVKPNDDRVVFRGSLGLDSRPQGARVFVNGLDVGRTPIDLRNLEVGSRAVRLELTGYQPWSSVIRVVTDQRSRVTANLLPASIDQPPTLGNESPVTFDETSIP